MAFDVVLGLDLATSTGWAAYGLDGLDGPGGLLDDLLDSGVWDLSLADGEHEGLRFNRLNQRLTKLIVRFDGRVAAIGVEDVFSGPTQQGGKEGMSKRSNAVLWGLRATVESVAALHRRPDGIPVVAYAQSTVKKIYVGKGNASLAQVIAHADSERRLKFGDDGTAKSATRRGDEAIARGVARTAIASNKRADLLAGRLTVKKQRRGNKRRSKR